MDQGAPWWFLAVAGFIGVVFVLTVAGGAYVAVRNRNALKQAGYDPLTAQVQMADRLIRSQERPPLEARLQELDDLHARGVISDEEHRAARAEALSRGGS